MSSCCRLPVPRAAAAGAASTAFGRSTRLLVPTAPAANRPRRFVAARYRDPTDGGKDTAAASAAEERRRIGERDIDMTGGVGDYFVEFEDEGIAKELRALWGRAQDKWAATENKGEVVGYTAALSLGIWTAFAIVGAVDRVPLVPQLLKFVGVWFSGWFAWRYLLFHEGREELARDARELKGSLAARATNAYMRAAEGARPPAGAAKGGPAAHRLIDLDGPSGAGGAARPAAPGGAGDSE